MIRRRKPLRKTGIRRRPKTARQKLIDEADAVWREKALRRDSYQCRRCGSTWAVLAVHHVVTRAKHSVRWVLANGLTLCTGCHFWVHNHLLASRAVGFYASLGADLEAMEMQSQQSWKHQDIKLIIIGLKMGVS